MGRSGPESVLEGIMENDNRKHFPGTRQTWLFRQTPGVRNAVYPWVIMQDANGSTVKLSEEQMKGIVNTYLDAMGYDLI